MEGTCKYMEYVLLCGRYVGDKLVCASLNGSVEGNGWYLYGILHGFVANVKSTIGEQTDW